MSSIFDGMTDIFLATFGSGSDDPILVFPGGATVGTEVTGILRNVPVEGADDMDGAPVLSSQYTLKIQPTDATGLGRDDKVTHNGKTFKVINSVPGGSPAADGFEIFQLKLVRNP